MILLEDTREDRNSLFNCVQGKHWKFGREIERHLQLFLYYDDYEVNNP